jgi:hypothetical protein
MATNANDKSQVPSVTFYACLSWSLLQILEELIRMM